MKNVFWLITVCLIFGIYSCSTKTEEKVAITENETQSEVENTSEIEANSEIKELAEVSDAIQNDKEIKAEENEEKNNLPEKKKEEEPKTPKKTESPKPKTVNSKPKPASQPVKTEPVKEEIKIENQTIEVPGIVDSDPTPPPPKPKPKPVKEEIKEVIEEEIELAEVVPVLSHDEFDALLKKYVSSSGDVNYAGFKSEKTKLESYLKHLENFPPENNWAKNKKLAYWFNLYNAWTIKTIIDKYPIASITEIDGGKTWNVKRVKSGSNTYSLDEVENQIIRPRFKDGRIHFAVNCAAKSCPPLLNKAWTEHNTLTHLEKQTKNFINNQTYNQISAKEVKISKIFEWYAVDFGDIITYLNKYSNTKIDKNAKVEYIEYDWSLNGK